MLKITCPECKEPYEFKHDYPGAHFGWSCTHCNAPLMVYPGTGVVVVRHSNAPNDVELKEEPDADTPG